MPGEGGTTEKRFNINYFDGINSTVQPTLAKRTELYHVENARAPQIGVIEKREGQAVYGTATGGGTFQADSNHGLFKFPTDDATQADVFRVSVPDGGSTANIYALDTGDEWDLMADVDAQGITTGQFDTTIADRNLIMTNKNDENRLIKRDGSTVLTASDAGDLFNSPDAAKCAYYKGRIHLANFSRDGDDYPTTVVRSSFPLGIIALVDGDSASHASGTNLAVTDTKYFYTDAGMNTYEVYRGGTLISTITVTAINESSVTVTHTGTPDFESADEVWIQGTFDGEKQYRWVNNPTISGRDVKQYDTFRLSGGEGDGITMFETVGNVLMIANKNSLASWDDFNLQSMDMGIGCVSDTGYTKLLGSLFFIHYTGIYATTGGAPTLLSRKVSRYIDGATKAGLEASAAGVKGLSVFFTIGDVTLYEDDGSVEKTLSDACLEYSIKDQNWYVHTNVPVTQLLNFIDSGGTERLLASRTSTDFPVIEFLTGNTDLGSEIFFRMDTQPLQMLAAMEQYVNPISLITEVQRGSQMICHIKIDNAPYYQLKGNVKKGISTIKVTSEDETKVQPVLARKVQLSYRDASKQRCRISQVAITYIPSSVSAPAE
jgi:hypothetical protein